MEKHLPSFGIPCPFLKIGQCPNGDGCEHAHDFIAQPCLSAAQIDYRMRDLEDARPADRNERVKIKRRKAHLRRMGARKLAAPSLIERGIVPTKKAITHELGRYTVGPPNNTGIASSAVRERAFPEGGEGGGGERRVGGVGRSRRERKLLARMRQKSARAHAMSRRSGVNGNPPAEADPISAPGTISHSAEGASSGYTTRGNMDVDEVEMETPRRIEIFGDLIVKHPTSIAPHLRHRYSNTSPAAMNSPPPQNQPPYTDEGIIYAPPGEVVHENPIEKEHVAKRERALSF